MTRSSVPAWRNLRLGIFFLLGTIILMGSLFVVGTNQHLFRRKYDLTLHLENAQGLSSGGVVALSGLEVGRVKEIGFARGESGGQNLLVTFTVERRYRERITASSVATIRTVGVLGDKFIDISMGLPGEPPLPEGAELEVRGTVDWAATLERGTKALDDFLVLMHEASETMSRINAGQGTVGMLLHDQETAERFRGLVTSLGLVADRLRSGEGTLGGLLTEDATLERVNGVLDRMDELARSTREGEGLLPRLLNDRELSDRMDLLVARSDSLVTAVRTEGTTGRLIGDEALYDEFQTTLEELRALVQDMKTNPGKYVRMSIF